MVALSFGRPVFSEQPLWLNVAVFAAAAGVVWIAGTRIAQLCGRDRAQDRRRSCPGRACCCSPAITSLPEVAVTVTAAVGGNPELAVNNLLGSIAMQVAILAVADAVIGQDALTSVHRGPRRPAAARAQYAAPRAFRRGRATGDVGFSASAPGRACCSRHTSAPSGSSPSRRGGSRGSRAPAAHRSPRKGREDSGETAARALAAKTAAAGAAILVAGFLVSKTGEAIGEQTGMGQSFAGFLLVAMSTSLPELSTVIASVRLRRYVMAVSDIFGTNLFNIGLIFLVDVAYRGGPILSEVEPLRGVRGAPRDRRDGAVPRGAHRAARPDDRAHGSRLVRRADRLFRRARRALYDALAWNPRSRGRAATPANETAPAGAAESGPASRRRARAPAPDLGAADGPRVPHGHQQQLHRRLLRRHGVPVLHPRRHPRAAHAHAARRAGERPSSGPALYNQLFTMHGTVMMFLFAVPAVEAMGVLLLPNMLGARDLPFPRLSAYAFWAYLVGGLVFFSQHLLRARAARRLVHVPAAHDRARTRRASTRISGCSASASSRSRRSRARSRSSSACCARARRA